MLILLDTNIIVSGLLGQEGPPARLLGLWGDGHFTLVTSVYQLEELTRVLNYTHLKSRIKPEKASVFLANAEKRAVVLSDLPTVDLSPDPKDNPILATAIAGNAEMIVSGDKGHMLVLGQANGIPILTAREAIYKLDDS